MKKLYFSHNMDASLDSRHISLIIEHGIAGYGCYWLIIEYMYRNKGLMKESDIKNLAFTFHIDESEINNILENEDLFYSEASAYKSKGVDKRIDLMELDTELRSQRAKDGWENRKGTKQVQSTIKASAKQSESKCNVSKVKESKEEESKLNESKEEDSENEKNNYSEPPDRTNNFLFKEFMLKYGMYPPEEMGKAKNEWNKLSRETQNKAYLFLQPYLIKFPNKDDRPTPFFYLRNETWEYIIEDSEQTPKRDPDKPYISKGYESYVEIPDEKPMTKKQIADIKKSIKEFKKDNPEPVDKKVTMRKRVRPESKPMAELTDEFKDKILDNEENK